MKQKLNGNMVKTYKFKIKEDFWIIFFKRNVPDFIVSYFADNKKEMILSVTDIYT